MEERYWSCTQEHIPEQVELARDGFRRDFLFLVANANCRALFVAGTAKDGAEAIQLVELRPQTVLTEINLPVLDGLAVTKIIRDQFPAVQVIILPFTMTMSSGTRH